MSELDNRVKRELDMSAKRELGMSAVERPAPATKKVKRETMRQQLHRHEEQLRTWKNRDGESLPQAPIGRSAQASDSRKMPARSY
jgi:hypothetical protein